MGQVSFFPATAASAPAEPVTAAIGRLICAWGMLEGQVERKIGDLRSATGEVRSVGARTKPSMQKLFSELRTVIQMRDRRNASALPVIAEIERVIQMIDRFRMLIVQGFHGLTQPGRGSPGFLCRDPKNNMISVSVDDVDQAVARLEEIRSQVLGL